MNRIFFTICNVIQMLCYDSTDFAVVNHRPTQAMHVLIGCLTIEILAMARKNELILNSHQTGFSIRLMLRL